jgi:hypothetical protein
MQVDISREILRWKALDRWENEGGRAPSDRMELITNGSSGNVRAESIAHAHPAVEEQLYSNRKTIRQSCEHLWKMRPGMRTPIPPGFR